MMPCAVCGNITRVVDSRPTADSVYRRRICPSGHRFSTNEVVIELQGIGKNNRKYLSDKNLGSLGNLENLGSKKKR